MVRCDNPCDSLKAAAQKAIDMARIKMNNMLNDPDKLFGSAGWATHMADLQGRLANIAAIISLGQKMGCDMSNEVTEASTFFIPSSPR